MLSVLLSLAYYGVAALYLGFGVLLLFRPQLAEPYLKSIFPLLASYKYRLIGNSINLILIGAGLIVIGNLLAHISFVGFFIALVLSGLEVCLGFFFYYREENDVLQAVIHVVLHVILVIMIGYFVLEHFSDELHLMQTQATMVATPILWWK